MELCILNIFITANNGELGARFHSLKSKSNDLCAIHVASVS